MDKTNLPLYLLMCSYGKGETAVKIIQDYLKATKPINTNFLVFENSLTPNLLNLFNFSENRDIKFYHYPKKNKASVINYALRAIISEKEALVICIDNDIRFKSSFLIRYYEEAIRFGSNYYFGGSFSVNVPSNVDTELIPYLQGSQRGKSDKEFLKMKNPMFLGFSYAFFKSQWKKVNGLDERFSPGSKYGLAAEESIFQKKLIHAGYIPHFVSHNSVEHKPLPDNYSFKNVLIRQENNGYTHGFQDLVRAKHLFKISYFKKLLYLLKRTVVLNLKGSVISCKLKTAYLKGYSKALVLYIRIEDRTDFLKF